jgi:hypothetical protein
MTKKEDALVKRAYREYRSAKRALDALEETCVEISESSSIMTKEGYLMFAPSGVCLRDIEYVREQIANYRVARKRKEALRKRLIDLGEPDPG